MTHLAKEFALSDVALHKICRKHDVPNPPLGWWAKKAAGQKVKQAPLPKAKPGDSARITIAGGELRQEPELIAAARENARVQVSTIVTDAEINAHPLVARTAERLRKAKPSDRRLVGVEGAGLIKAAVAPASIDRFELALNRIATAAATIGITLVKGEKAAVFLCEGETVGFAVNEGLKREKHVLTDKERDHDEAARRRLVTRRRSNEWDDEFNLSFSRLQRPEWDYHPTGLLALEFDQTYFLDASPRRSFRDAKTQRLETLASDIAVGIAVFAAARKHDGNRRDEEARKREDERVAREFVLRANYVAKRRGEVLDQILDEFAALDRLRRLVTGLRGESVGNADDRVAAFLGLAEERLTDRESALSAEGLSKRFEAQRVFGDDDDHGYNGSYRY